LENSDAEDDELDVGQRPICAACVGDAYLKSDVEKNGGDNVCYYCDSDGKTVPILEIADTVESAFERHYTQTPTDPTPMEYAVMKHGDFDWERNGDPAAYAIGDAAGLDEDPAEDIREILYERNYDFELAKMSEEIPFDEEAHYETSEPSDAEYRENWNFFERDLKTEARFFNAEAKAILDDVFEELADHTDLQGDPIIVNAGPETEWSSLYRARVFQTMDELEIALARPDLHIGPPPAAVARAGRMNAHGISVFYGANNTDVAIGEVRPPVGSRVMVGRFKLLRKIKLLDVAALQSVYVDGSIFDPTFINRLERAKFLERLSNRITRPVMPNDEASEYLITQVIADYLASRSDPELDGILYPSVQNNPDGSNVMLFHKASRVAPMDLPAGTEVEAFTFHEPDDEGEPDYWVSEEVPVEGEKGERKDADPFSDFEIALAPMPLRYGEDFREDTLELDVDSVTVHYVKASTFDTSPRPVRRHRSVKSATASTPSGIEF